jgi:hypothetical protein
MKLTKDTLMTAFEKMLSQFPEAVENETLDAEGTESYEDEGEGMEEEEDSMEIEVKVPMGKKKKKQHGLSEYMKQMM